MAKRRFQRREIQSLVTSITRVAGPPAQDPGEDSAHAFAPFPKKLGRRIVGTTVPTLNRRFLPVGRSPEGRIPP
jgi:hypothetical protein